MAQPDVSPNIHFRELDDEFMQKQAKVWLEAVLDERYGESTSLADLLADGDILFRVSILFKELIRGSNGGDAAFPRLPLRSEIGSDGKGGKYLPYSNVDAFLKICKRVGLPDVDLFSPPDVVEKKDIRRVCFCIRALSKKSRTQNLPVPDFDKVTHAVPMPTDKVGGIREHLQQQASMSPEVKTPRNQSIGKVLSSPSIAGSAFLDTPPSVKQESFVDSGRSSPRPDSSLESEEATSSKFEDEEEEEQEEEEAGSYEEKQSPSPGEISETSSQVIEDSDQQERELEEEQTYNYQEFLTQNSEQAPVRNRNRVVISLAIGAAAVLASVLAAVLLKPRQKPVPEYHVVKKGDTLSKISRAYGKKKWDELVAINPDLASNPDLIYPTDRLKLV